MKQFRNSNNLFILNLLFFITFGVLSMKKFIIIFTILLSSSFIGLSAKSTTMVGGGLAYGTNI